MREKFIINELYPIICFTNNKKDIDIIKPFKLTLLLNLEFDINSKNIFEILKKSKRIVIKLIYIKNINLMEYEKFYKVLLNKYNSLFKKSIYWTKNELIDKKELLLFIKLNQDLQFYKKFDVDQKNSLNSEIKNDLNNLFENKYILNLIDIIIENSKIIIEIDNALIEFEEKIIVKTKINDNNVNEENENENENKNKNKNETVNDA